MRRCCRDPALADDLAQQVFLQLWLKLHTLKQANAFGAWLNRLAVTVWLQHQRKEDALRSADELAEAELAQHDSTSVAMELDQALAKLNHSVRLCATYAH